MIYGGFFSSLSECFFTFAFALPSSLCISSFSDCMQCAVSVLYASPFESNFIRSILWIAHFGLLASVCSAIYPCKKAVAITFKWYSENRFEMAFKIRHTKQRMNAIKMHKYFLVLSHCLHEQQQQQHNHHSHTIKQINRAILIRNSTASKHALNIHTIPIFYCIPKGVAVCRRRCRFFSPGFKYVNV